MNAGLFLDGLLSDERRKTGWMRAEATGDPGRWRQHASLGRDCWEADALRDLVCECVIEHFADNDAVLVIDETGFLKQAKHRAARRGNAPGRQVKSRIVGSVCLPLMYRTAVGTKPITRYGLPDVCRRRGPVCTSCRQ